MTGRIEELQRLHEAATGGPWFAHNTEDSLFMNAYAVTTSESEPNLDGCTDFHKEAHDKSVVALTLLQQPRVVGHESNRWAEDADLIAAMRNALPALLRVARAAKAIRERNQVSDWVFTDTGKLTDHGELFAGLDELERDRG